MSEQNFKQNKRFLPALPAGRISHFTSRIYPSLASCLLSRVWHRLLVFPLLAQVAYFPALDTGGLFSRAWHRLLVFQCLAQVACFPVLGNGCVLSVALHCLHAIATVLVGPCLCLLCPLLRLFPQRHWFVLQIWKAFDVIIRPERTLNAVLLFVAESRFLFGVSSRMSLWEQISINLAVLINLLVAFFYPFADGAGGRYHCINRARRGWRGWSSISCPGEVTITSLVSVTWKLATLMLKK